MSKLSTFDIKIFNKNVILVLKSKTIKNMLGGYWKKEYFENDYCDIKKGY